MPPSLPQVSLPQGWGQSVHPGDTNAVPQPGTNLRHPCSLHAGKDTRRVPCGMPAAS